jgi:hypothetical protein
MGREDTMKSILRPTATALLALLIFSALAADSLRAMPPPIPNPVLIFIGQEPYTVSGNNFIRYRYNVVNLVDYPNNMFAAAPALPPCGSNTNSSRSWVDIFDQRGKRLYGFCNFRNHDDLDSIWFAMPEGDLPPSWIYIEINDRQTNTKYKSNLAETTL